MLRLNGGIIFMCFIGCMTQRGVFLVPENINQGRWISLQEVCYYIGVKRHTVMRWIEQRGMPASKVGKLWRFKTADIDEWIKKGGASNEPEGIPLRRRSA